MKATKQIAFSQDYQKNLVFYFASSKKQVIFAPQL